jgi:ABC-type transport system involved in multi-copper enzyme maturation permease subunit
MLKLICLEWKKNHITKYIRNAVILAGILCFFFFAQSFLGIARDAETGRPDAAQGYDMLSPQIELLTSISFLVFTSVMLATFIVNAYQNKTMTLMFSYPIKRRKILISQMLAVWIFNVISLITTKVLIYGVILFFSYSKSSDFIIDYNMTGYMFYIQILLKSIFTVTLGFISLFVGLIMKSSKATVINSFLLIMLTEASIGDFSLADNAVFPAVLMVISLIFAYLSIHQVESKDLM